MINRHTKFKLPNMCQSLDIGLDSLYCGKWRKISKSRCDLDLDLDYRETDRQTRRQTPRQQDRHTHTDTQRER